MSDSSKNTKTGKKATKKAGNCRQIVSRERVVEHGEVYTSDREVKAMVDLVKNEAERIESTFLEPACGDGNFLIEILSRKLKLVFNKYRKSQTECEKYLVVAVGSIYGIDILPDNVQKCRERLFKMFKKAYHQKCKSYASVEFESVIQYILRKNIILGNALTMKNPEGTECIVFSQWAVTTGCNVKRRDFVFEQMLMNSEKQSKLNDEEKALYIETGMIESFIDQPVREYPSVHYMGLIEND